MKKLRNYIDRIKPHFEKGGRLEKLHSTFDALETFLFVPNKTTSKGTHIRDSIDLKRTMSIVIVALLPALFFGIWNVGYLHFASAGQVFGKDIFFQDVIFFGLLKVMPIVIASYITGLTIEFAFAQFRGHEVNEGFLVTGMLIPLTMPATVPIWMVIVATAFAVIIGKEAFGGTGMNILNPALLARSFIFFAYPAFISGDQVWIAAAEQTIDGFSGATPLGLAAAGNISSIPDNLTLLLGTFAGSIGETSKLAILIGAAILLITGIGSWRIMLSAVLGGIFMTSVFNYFGANAYMTIPPLTQLLMGSFLFGVVFMATDPVTASQTNRGKWIYGFLIGVFTILIRVFNPAYPEGTMLAILLMNVFAPLIDHYVVESNIKHRLKRVKTK